jgi:hypothetical protein
MKNNDLFLGIAIGAAVTAILLHRRNNNPVIEVRPQTTPGIPSMLPAGQMSGYPFRGGTMIARKPPRPAHYNYLQQPGYPMPGWAVR